MQDLSSSWTTPLEPGERHEAESLAIHQKPAVLDREAVKRGEVSQPRDHVRQRPRVRVQWKSKLPTFGHLTPKQFAAIVILAAAPANREIDRWRSRRRRNPAAVLQIFVFVVELVNFPPPRSCFSLLPVVVGIF